MDNLTIKKSTFRWLVLAAGLIVISLVMLTLGPYVPAKAQSGGSWHWHTFADSYDGNNGVHCPVGEQIGGAYVDWAFNSNIQVYIDPNRMYAYRYNPQGTTTRFGFQWANGADYLGLDWGSVTQFQNFHDPSHDRFMAFDIYNIYGQPGAVACFGVEATMTPTPTATPTATPDPELSCKVEGQNITMDLVPGASVTGSLSARPYDYSTPGDLIDVITFELAKTIPLTYGSPGQARQGTIKLDLAGANILYIDSWINDTFVPTSPTELNYIPIDGGQTTETISYIGYVHRSLADFGPSDTPRITAITIQYTAANAGTQLICDGGMTKSVSDTPWQRTNDEEFGRGWMDWFGTFNGFPACEPGQQSIAHQGYTGVGSRGQYSPVKQAFQMPAGSSTLNWKFRYRSRPDASWLGLYPGTPNVYITDASGAIAADLIGSVNYDPGFIATDWTLITGSLSLSPGKYYLVLNQGYKYDGGGAPDLAASGQLYYDDVQLTTGAVDMSCSDWVSLPPELLPTATPSPSPTPTATGTQPTPTPTLFVEGTSSAMPTPSRTSTLRSTPTQRLTPSPSRTMVPSGTATQVSTWTPNPRETSIYAGTVTPTPNGGGGGVGPVCIPFVDPNCVWEWPNTWENPNPPTNGDGNYQGTGPGNGGWVVSCQKPDHWYQINWWMDYERCIILASVAWGPSQSATMVALPGFMTTKEPFNTVYQISHGLSSMSTQAAVYNWTDTGMSGVNTNVTPDPRFIFSSNLADPGGGVSLGNPWAAGGTINLTLGGSAASSSSYSVVCNTRLSNMMAARLGEGLCFVLNITRSMGYLGWVQFLTNGMILFSIVRLFLGAIRYYSFFGQAPVGSSKTAAEE